MSPFPSRRQVVAMLEDVPGRELPEETLLYFAGEDPRDLLDLEQRLSDLVDDGYLVRETRISYRLADPQPSVPDNRHAEVSHQGAAPRGGIERHEQGRRSLVAQPTDDTGETGGGQVRDSAAVSPSERIDGQIGRAA